jgi:23S rRNA (uracil1939-C5)-methyltransferase
MRPSELVIERLGYRGEGVAEGAHGSIFVPYTLPGDTILADVQGERGRLVEILVAGPDRIAAFCPHFTVCGGCAVQTLAEPAYATWKRSIVTTALAHAGVAAEVAPLVDAHGEGRRRATFHARSRATGAGRITHVGFMEARAHAIVDLRACPVLAPAMAGALPAARAIAQALAVLDKPLDLIATATLSGLDIDVRGCGPLPEELRNVVTGLAQSLDLARVSNHGDVLVERRAPGLSMGQAFVTPPPGAFLQATLAGETALATLVLDAVAGAKRIADLFAGIGTFSLRLASLAPVHAVETDKAALAALTRAANAGGGTLRPLTSEARDLFRRPLTRPECEAYDAVVFDPPRAGAAAQARMLAGSSVATVVAVSCNAASFAQDAHVLVDGGYVLEKVTPVDQFRHSPHVELVGVFRRGKPRRKKSLLG